MKRFLVLFSLLLVAGVPKIASATPVSYSVSGSLYVSDEGGVWGWKDDLLWGHVEIDDEVDINNLEAPAHIFYHFWILDYAIFAEGNPFAGDAGAILLETDYNTMAFRDWHLPSFGSSWFWGYVDFINEDGTSYDRYDAESWQTLAPQIMLAGEVDFGGAQGTTGAILTLNKTSPVPEPSTLILLSTGIVGLAAFRQKYKK